MSPDGTFRTTDTPGSLISIVDPDFANIETARLG